MVRHCLMKFRVFLRLLAQLLKLLAVLLLVPGAVAATYAETGGVIAFAATSLLSLATGIVMARLSSEEEPGLREAFALVAIGWIVVAFFGALPYAFLGMSLIDGLFESMSAFTTTGSSIFTETNALGYWTINQSLTNSSPVANIQMYLMNVTGSSTPLRLRGSPDDTIMGLLFWRSFAQWLGGMGIILLFVAILPRLGVAGRQLYRAEVPGPEKESIKPRIKQNARMLWMVYILLTIAEIGLLLLAGMPRFDSVCHAFSSMATGGFSPRGLSIIAYNSWIIDAIIVLFCFLAGANFVLHYRVLTSDRKALISDSEFRVYALIVLLATSIIILWGGLEGDIFQKIQLAGFQVVSILTTTGFVTADFNHWTATGKITLLLLMIIGACAGSTAGAIKVVRLILIFKSAYRELIRTLHPKAVLSVRLGEMVVREEILRASNIFVSMYIIIFAIASLLLAMICSGDPGMDIESVLSAVAATLGNVGPGLGAVGPMFSFAHIHPAGKLLLILCMWIGRLEVVTALVLLVPEFWKK